MTDTVVPPGLARDQYPFAEACALLGLAPPELKRLRAAGLAVAAERGRRQHFPAAPLAFTRYLLRLGRAQGWDDSTLSWYADLLFASEVGRLVLLPVSDGYADIAGKSHAAEPSGESPLPVSWLEASPVTAFLRDTASLPAHPAPQVASVLHSLLAACTGDGRFWPTPAHARASALGPLLRHFPVPETGGAETASSSQPFALLVLAFATLAPAITPDLRRIVTDTYARLRGGSENARTALVLDRERIRRERMIAVDQVYAEQATEIHSPPTEDQLSLGFDVLPHTQKRIVALEVRKPNLALTMPLEAETPEAAARALDNILDIIRPFLGAYGARVVQLLYEIANDPPTSVSRLSRSILTRCSTGWARSATPAASITAATAPGSAMC